MLSATATPRPPEGPTRHRRQRQRRLSMTEITELIKEYEQRGPVNQLAQQFGIHRTTVTALLRRHEVKLRRAGLAPAEIPTVALLYSQGWSLSRLGAKYGVDAATVWRALRGGRLIHSNR